MSPRTTEITIHGIAFAAPQPFSEGHTCNAGEASVLNSVLAENLRNNFSRRVKAHLESRGGLGPDEDKLRVEFAEYAASYSLSPRVSTDPVARAAHRIAADLVREALNKKGLRPSDLVDGVFDEHVAVVAQRDNVLAEARRRVEATKSIVSQTLDLEGLA